MCEKNRVKEILKNIHFVLENREMMRPDDQMLIEVYDIEMAAEKRCGQFEKEIIAQLKSGYNYKEICEHLNFTYFVDYYRALDKIVEKICDELTEF